MFSPQMNYSQTNHSSHKTSKWNKDMEDRMLTNNLKTSDQIPCYFPLFFYFLNVIFIAKNTPLFLTILKCKNALSKL